MKKIFTILFLIFSIASYSQVRISQVYGGGGNSGATYTTDFVEIFNAGTAAVDISGYTIQYSSATGTGNWGILWTFPASTTINPGKYILVAGATGGAVGVALPTPDFSGSTNMSGSAGKVALVSNNTLLSGAGGCATSTVVDVLGYGSTANCAEGTLYPATGITNAQSIFRKSGGCTDTNNNSTDFELLAVSPRNSATAASPCSAISSLSTSPTSITGLTTSVGTASASQSFTISGLNLTPTSGNITVTAPANFEVSSDNTSFGTTASVAYTTASPSGLNAYVRIASTAPLGAVSGTVSLSGGGQTASLAVSGSVNVAEPTTQANNISFSNITDNAADISWTNGNGTERIVVIRPTSATEVAPADGTTYTANPAIAFPAVTGGSNYVAYIGTGTTVSVSNLNPGTNYTVRVYEFNGTAGSENYLTATATLNPNTFSTTGISSVVTQGYFHGIAVPQFMASGNTNRLPTMFFAKVTGLTPSTTYRYYTQGGATTDIGTASSGAGVILAADYTVSTSTPVIYNQASTGNLGNSGANGQFTTDASGNFQGAFGFIHTSNARFGTASMVYPILTLNDGTTSTSVRYRLMLDQSIKALAFGTNNNADTGTFIQGSSSAIAGNLVGLWSTVDGNLVAQRPLSMGLIESPTTVNPSNWTNPIAGYSNVDGTWNTIIPNANVDGVKLIQQIDAISGVVIGCATDADGVWPSGANTVSPAGGVAAPVLITNTDAPLTNTVGCNVILPVNLVSFFAQKNNQTSLLTWKTNVEVNSKVFIVERSKDNLHWSAIGTVAAAGNSSVERSYTFTDVFPSKGNNYYRLQMVDMDNSSKASATRSLSFDAQQTVLITPNPASNVVNVYADATNGKVQILMTSISGKTIAQYYTSNGKVQIPVQGLAKGIYVVKVNADGNTSTHKVVVQ